MDENSKGGYGKRPMWQWILIYVVVGLVVYGAVYYFVFANKGDYSAGGQNQGTQQSYP